jgi:hypothetical protein
MYDGIVMDPGMNEEMMKEGEEVTSTVVPAPLPGGVQL